MRCCDCEFRKECNEQDTVLTCFVKCNIREEKLKQEVETLKDNNEHLAVMLSEAKAEVAREIICIINQRLTSNLEQRKGVRTEFWTGVCTGREYAYRDIKEIIEQKYTEEKECTK